MDTEPVQEGDTPPAFLQPAELVEARNVSITTDLPEDKLENLEPSQPDLSRLEALMAELDRKFEQRLLMDAHKNAIIDRLHAELQEHKAGLFQALVAPILTDLIRLHGDVSALLRQLSAQPDLTGVRALKSMATIPDDIADILNRNQAESFEDPVGEPFNAARHKLARRIPTDDPAASRTLAALVRPGFIWNGRLLSHQLVDVHVHMPAPSSGGSAGNAGQGDNSILP